MQSVKEASVNWIRRHVIELWPEEPRPDEVAEQLAAWAAKNGVPIERVIEWLHEQHAAGEEAGVFASAREAQCDAGTWKDVRAAEVVPIDSGAFLREIWKRDRL